MTNHRIRRKKAGRPGLSVAPFAARFHVVLGGRRIAPAPLRRDGGGKSEHHRARCHVTRARSAGIHAGGRLKDLSTDSATENQTARVSQETRVRVKRCGKSAPREAQATRHGKPHRVQGQIGNPGAARSRSRESVTDSGYRLPRQMILSSEEIRSRQNSAYSPSKTNSQSRRDTIG